MDDRFQHKTDGWNIKTISIFPPPLFLYKYILTNKILQESFEGIAKG